MIIPTPFDGGSDVSGSCLLNLIFDLRLMVCSVAKVDIILYLANNY